jgi:hypothetical protein
MPIQPVHAEKLATGNSAGSTNRKIDGRQATAKPPGDENDAEHVRPQGMMHSDEQPEHASESRDRSVQPAHRPPPEQTLATPA